MNSFFARRAAIALIVAALLVGVACQNPTASSNNDSNGGGSSGDNGSAEPGASLAADINPGVSSSNPAHLTVYNGALYFSANDGTPGTELWRYDGAEAVRVMATASGPETSGPRSLAVFDGRLYFAAEDGGDLPRLYRYNGSSVELAGEVEEPLFLTEYRGSLYMHGLLSPYGQELFRLDSGTNTVVLAADINENASSSIPQYLTVYNDELYFQADEGEGEGRELWRFDGDDAFLAADIRQGGDGRPRNLIVYDERLYFHADDGGGFALWAYDSGTHELISNHLAHNSEMIVYNNALYYVADDGAGWELWSYDGSDMSRATYLNSGAGTGVAVPAQMAVYEGALYFAGDDGSGSGVELYRYDGEDVELAADINSGGSSNPKNFAVYDGRLYFQADDGDSGAELWTYYR